VAKWWGVLSGCREWVCFGVSLVLRLSLGQAPATTIGPDLVSSRSRMVCIRRARVHLCGLVYLPSATDSLREADDCDELGDLQAQAARGGRTIKNRTPSRWKTGCISIIMDVGAACAFLWGAQMDLRPYAAACRLPTGDPSPLAVQPVHSDVILIGASGKWAARK